jgi:ATP/ADP translocase
MQLINPAFVANRMNIPSSLCTGSPGSLLVALPLVRTALPFLLASATSTSTSEQEEDGDGVRGSHTDVTNTDSDTSTPSVWDPSVSASAPQQHSSKMDQAKQLILLPRPRAALYMATAMALHFGGYEFVRSGMLALFTSSTVGFSNPGAFALAMGLVSPFSFLLLMGYGSVLEKRGPRAALTTTTFASFLVFAVTAITLQLLQTTTSTAQSTSRAIVALAFIYQNSYAHLLYNQHWSFLSSIMTPQEGSIWFSSIAGLSSVVCTVTGTLVKPLVNTVGLVGMVGCNCVFLLLSILCSDRAYQLAETHGFDPAKIKEQQNKVPLVADSKPADKPNQNLVVKARDLFQRVPTLGALFGEVFTFQSMSVILNIAMVTRLKQVMPNDNERAAWTGRLFAGVSGISGLLQFIVLPLFLQRIEPRMIWRCMPLVPLVFSVYQSFQGASPSLGALALSFFVAKTMDYSIRGVVNEMVYQPLDFDSRYLGKEIIGIFGSRFGKSGVSLLLSGSSYLFPNFGIYHLSKLSVIACVSWMSMSWRLSQLVPKRSEAQEAFLEQRRSNGRQQQREPPEASNLNDILATKEKEE